MCGPFTFLLFFSSQPSVSLPSPKMNNSNSQSQVNQSLHHNSHSKFVADPSPPQQQPQRNPTLAPGPPHQVFYHPQIASSQQHPYLLQSGFTPISPRQSSSPSPLLSPAPYFAIPTRTWSAIPESNMSGQYTGHSRQIAPASTPEGSDRLSRTRSTPSSSTAPTSTVEPSSTSGLRASSFWVQEGMDTFFDWLTDPHNYARLQKKNPIAGQRQADLHKEICRLVNNKHKTSWTEAQVKSKITYAKSKYREAAGLNSTGEGPVLHRQEEICPLFVRLHTVLGGSLSANPPPPRQTGGKRQREDPDSSDDSEEESSDLEPLNDTSDTASHAGTHPSLYSWSTTAFDFSGKKLIISYRAFF